MDEQKLRQMIERALEEDIGQGDVTSMWALLPNSIARAKIVTQEAGIAAGLSAAEGVFIGGGNTFVLLQDLYEHDLVATLRNRIAAGMPYAGTSAGSNVAAGPSGSPRHGECAA